MVFAISLHTMDVGRVTTTFQSRMLYQLIMPNLLHSRVDVTFIITQWYLSPTDHCIQLHCLMYTPHTIKPPLSANMSKTVTWIYFAWQKHGWRLVISMLLQSLLHLATSCNTPLAQWVLVEVLQSCTRRAWKSPNQMVEPTNLLNTTTGNIYMDHWHWIWLMFTDQYHHPKTCWLPLCSLMSLPLSWNDI